MYLSIYDCVFKRSNKSFYTPPPNLEPRLLGELTITNCSHSQLMNKQSYGSKNVNFYLLFIRSS